MPRTPRTSRSALVSVGLVLALVGAVGCSTAGPDAGPTAVPIGSTDATALGEHQLGHEHSDEQPFTRAQTGLRIPGDVDEVTVEGRDQANGYGGGTVDVEVPRGPA